MKRGRPKGQSRDNKSYGPLGDLIRSYRIKHRLGLLDLAKACDCSVQFISNIEHGRAPLPWDKAEKLAKALEIPISELQAANLAIRADFKSFMGGNAAVGKKVKKSATALSSLKDAASLVALASEDAQLKELIQRYQLASVASRKKFVAQAKKLLSE